MKKAPRKTLTAPIRRVRFVWVALFFCVWVAVISGRLAWLQLVRHTEFAERAQKQQQRTFEVAPRRGVLYDRNLRELAMTVLVDSVYAVPSEIDDKAGYAAKLSAIIHTDPADRFTSEPQMEARLNGQRNFAWVARKLDAETAQRVRELHLPGIYFQKEFKRFYPNGELAAHVLGYVGTDDDGLGGMERKFEGDLHGQPGHVLTAIDAKRRVLGSEENDPQPGENLVLTIDSNIQYMAEHALDAQMAKVKALHGTVVVQDPHTGQVLALAVSPRFNPNDKRHNMGPDTLTNLAVSDVYEPGSTFKLVTYSAALDAAGVQPTDMVDCQGGSINLHGRIIHDDKSDIGMGKVTVQRALEKSSDVAAVKLALKLGPQTFYSYMKAYGFGNRSNIELPSETYGLLRPPQRWSATSIGSLAIGQEIGVTPVQLVTMVSTIANGGVYMPPHILLEKTDVLKGDPRLTANPFRPAYQLPAQLPRGAHRVINEMTAAKMRAMMAGIVTEGTGTAAQLNGYSSAGKTGTAQKYDKDTKSYSHTKLVASFAGFAPVSDPAISVTVVIDTPTVGSLYGSAVSAPVFHDVAQQVLEYLGVPHDQPVKTQQQMMLAEKNVAPDDVPDEQIGDLNAMFEQVNSLPADDPLRQPANSAAMAENQQADAAAEAKAKQTEPAHNGLAGLPDKVLAAFHANGDTTSVMPGANDSEAKVTPPVVRPPVQTQGNGAVVLEGGRRVAVPSFSGADLRSVVESAAQSGLRVQTFGSGTAREQAPVAGTMVPVGTEVLVRFAR